MDTKLATDNYRLHMWMDIIRTRIDSGLSVREWCRQNNVSRDRYFYWLRKVKAAALEDMDSRFVEITPSDHEAPGLPAPAPDRSLTKPDAKAVLLVGDISILIDEQTPRDLIVRAIEACRHAQ